MHSKGPVERVATMVFTLAPYWHPVLRFTRAISHMVTSWT